MTDDPSIDDPPLPPPRHPDLAHGGLLGHPGWSRDQVRAYARAWHEARLARLAQPPVTDVAP